MFKNKGFSILKEKKIQIEKSEAEKFYKVHETKPFYDDLCKYLIIRTNCCNDFRKKMQFLKIESLWGQQILKKLRDGTIRKKYGISID